MKNIAFIGLGNMGKAIASGLVKGGAVAAENAWGYDPYREGLAAFCADTGIQPCESAIEPISHADTVIIAVKPYVIEGVLAEIRDALQGKALISVALGYDHARLRLHLNESTRAQFVMPNTPAMVGAGVMIFEGTSSLEAAERAEIMEKFAVLGVVEELPSHLMGVGGAVSGCGPAFCALVIEARNFGESSLEGYGTSCTEAAKIALLAGRTLIGERVWDAMRILDGVAECFPRVDMTDIVCTGNSGGGTVTYYLACLDERITSAAPSCSVCTFEASIAAMPHCLCNHVPSIRKYFEMGDLAGLIAPRKLVVAAGKNDEIFPLPGVKEAYGVIEKAYRAAGAENNCALVIGEGGHLNYADLIWEKLHEMGV